MQVKTDELYSRGPYRLEWDRRKDGSLRSSNLQIVWYDKAARRNRSKSTGTADIEAAEDELDRYYLKKVRGKAICPTCGQPTQDFSTHLLNDAISNYLSIKEKLDSLVSVKSRLEHVRKYLKASEQLDLACSAVDDEWIEDFRDWAIEIPVISPSGNRRDRAPGTVEASVRQLAAVINFAFKRQDTTHPAGFKVKKPNDVSRTPTYRSSVDELARMFRYALKPGKDSSPMSARQPLLKFLQISVITWGRPDAAHDFSVSQERSQWHSEFAVVDLNPKGRVQTRKYRPQVPVGERAVALIEQADGYFVGVESVKSAFSSMLDELGLPRAGETGMKLIRRSIATLVRRRIGEEHFAQVERMLGHRKSSISDLYALFDANVLGRALGATNDIIEAIEALTPGAFAPRCTGFAPEQQNDEGTKNG